MNKLLIFLFIFPMLTIAQVGVNTSTPNAMLEVNSTNNGMLIPRVNLTSVLDNATVVNPQGGALITSTVVYNTTAAGVAPNNVLPGFYYWNNTLSRWIPIGGTNDWSLNGNTGITSPAAPAVYGTSTIPGTSNFIGTTDNNDVTLATNNIERMRVERTTGDIGIGIADPTEKLHVSDVSNTNKSTILGEAQQLTTGSDYQNIGVRGIGRGVSSWGYGIGMMGMGDTSTSYFSTGVYAHLGNTIPASTTTNQALFANGNNLGYSGIFTGGNVGIGTTAPNRLLHLNSATNGALRIVDGTQANGRVLTSDANGVATWQSTGIDNIVGVLSATGVSIPYNQTANFLQTGSYITLPPGRYAVNVTMLLARNSTPSPSPNNSFFWVRSSFSDSAGANPVSSPDIVGSTLASGNFGGTSVYAMLTGTIIINNTTAGNKTYYYVAGRTVFSNTTETLTGFGSTYWAEDNIIAYRLN